MTTSPVMTVTDELLAELEEAASNATQDEWELLPGTNLSGPEIIANGESIAWVLDSEADAVHMATANPQTITALTAELRRLRAENAEMAQSLAESRANDQAAMGWLTSLRWASGDRGERMLPELVTHIEGLAKDAGRYRWIAKRSTYGIDSRQRPSLTLPIYAPDHIGSLGVAIDTAMTAQ